MQQYFIQDKIQELIYFNDEQAHHIKNVMRMKENDIVKVVDSDEKACLVRIHYDSNKVVGQYYQAIENQMNKMKISLAMALIKKDKWEFCLQKASECGAYEIIPYVAQRSIVKIDEEKNDKKLLRWQKIASEACEQSKQNHCCIIHDILSFEELLQQEADLKLIAYENADKIAHNLANVCKTHPHVESILIMIGPEGGFNDYEVQKAISKGFYCISLGNRILRAETAAIASINMLTYHYEILEDLYEMVEKNS
ncbi:MAG: RsmE family RNA methyltransferase [Traorella sp.]